MIKKQRGIFHAKKHNASKNSFLFGAGMDICSFFSMNICWSIEADLILRRRFRHTINLLFLFCGFFAITFLRGLLLRVFTELQILKFGFSKMAIKRLIFLVRSPPWLFIYTLLNYKLKIIIGDKCKTFSRQIKFNSKKITWMAAGSRKIATISASSKTCFP